MEIRLKVLPLFEKIRKSSSNVIWLLGGTRSGKTYSALQFALLEAIQHPIRVFILRKTFPALRRSTLVSFEEILSQTQLKPFFSVSKQIMLYSGVNGSEIFFLSLDSKEKIKGTEMNLLIVDEINEFSYEEFLFLKTRISRQEPKGYRNRFILLSNPVYGWLYDLYLKHEGLGIDVIKANLSENPFITSEYKDYLQNLKDVNEALYKQLVIGEFAVPDELVFKNVITQNLYGFEPECYGVDFGFHNPTAVVGVLKTDECIYVKEYIYQSHLTNAELIDLIKEKTDTSKVFYCDSAEPMRISEFRKAGLKAVGVKHKIKDGVQFLLSHKIILDSSSQNLIREFRSYSFVKKDDIILDDFVKQNDHTIDATRYALNKYLSNTDFDFVIL